MNRWILGLAAAALLIFFPSATGAQTGTGSIAGTARDATGAVLPGVTVEASSPALIEKVRFGGRRIRAGNTRSSSCRPASTR